MTTYIYSIWNAKIPFIVRTSTRLLAYPNASFPPLKPCQYVQDPRLVFYESPARPSLTHSSTLPLVRSFRTLYITPSRRHVTTYSAFRSRHKPPSQLCRKNWNSGRYGRRWFLGRGLEGLSRKKNAVLCFYDPVGLPRRRWLTVAALFVGHDAEKHAVFCHPPLQNLSDSSSQSNVAAQGLSTLEVANSGSLAARLCNVGSLLTAGYRNIAVPRPLDIAIAFRIKGNTHKTALMLASHLDDPKFLFSENVVLCGRATISPDQSPHNQAICTLHTSSLHHTLAHPFFFISTNPLRSLWRAEDAMLDLVWQTRGSSAVQLQLAITEQAGMTEQDHRREMGLIP
ncbi:LOW QUALITY PROTEIN: hypothetical protein CVT26_003366 [Gymnopilus dilepis]|uniref:Uncharacterized protein n=1 Tax=Gymnopilus dilepis TaxID=231916 RepID=A0A409VQN8_9AGAR|nr:LOW QUALITY PROTEIN: hypothetical protein CVT26_003366 [Gymnopilus dilepis]